MRVNYPDGSSRDQDREWMLDQLSGGDAGIRQELSQFSDRDLASCLESEMLDDPDYWTSDD